MALLTFQILEGMERGQVLSELQPPITIGREEDNAIQLNDERVSRFHAKIQENAGRIILTDLESTNGTRVNGHPVKMHVLQLGDQVAIGRSLLLYGSADEIEGEIRRFASQSAEVSADGTVDVSQIVKDASEKRRDDDEEISRLFPLSVPELPSKMTGLQTAQITDLLAHFHDRVHSIVNAARVSGESSVRQAELGARAWQRLLRLQMDLASYLKKLGDPNIGDDV